MFLWWKTKIKTCSKTRASQNILCINAIVYYRYNAIWYIMQYICNLIGWNSVHIFGIFNYYRANINGMWNAEKLGRIYKTWKLPPGWFPPDNSHPENSHLGKYPPRITPTWTIPTQKIATQDNSHPKNSHTG